jgi:hypothetical protein
VGAEEGDIVFVELCTTTILGYPVSARQMDNSSVFCNSLEEMLEVFVLAAVIVNAIDIPISPLAIIFGTVNVNKLVKTEYYREMRFSHSLGNFS